MIAVTNKYRVKIDTPWTVKDEVTTSDTIRRPAGVQKFNLDKFPDVFAPIYQLEDGTQVCLHDLVWREKNGGVKQVQFSQIHIDNNSKIFGTSQACEEWLEKNAENIKTQMLEQNRGSSFQTLKAWANKLNDLDSLSPKDLLKIRDGIQGSIQNMEQI